MARRIATEATAADAPPVVTGVRSAFHVPGSLPGEGETQIFLSTREGRPPRCRSCAGRARSRAGRSRSGRSSTMAPPRRHATPCSGIASPARSPPRCPTPPPPRSSPPMRSGRAPTMLSSSRSSGRAGRERLRRCRTSVMPIASPPSAMASFAESSPSPAARAGPAGTASRRCDPPPPRSA
ncbi:hypothetical protein AB5I41_26240 [Sphingomonas sp. MMS24-JH45]